MTSMPLRPAAIILFATIAVVRVESQSPQTPVTTSVSDPVPFKPPEDIGYLPYPLAIMDRRTDEVYSFDPGSGRPARISYTVSKTGWVRIRLVLRENQNVVLRTLQDWRLSRFGSEYVTEWDGRDASGRLLDSRSLFVLFESKDQERAKVHGTHDVTTCRDLILRIVSPKDGSTTRDVISVVVARPDGSPPSSTYAGRLYADDVLVAEKRFEAGGPTSTLAFDEIQLSEGRHVLIVNIDDLHDHVGTASAVIIQR